MVTIRPASKAGQLRPSIKRPASMSMAMDIKTFTASQTKNPKAAEAALTEDSRPVMPRAMMADGKTTVRAP